MNFILFCLVLLSATTLFAAGPVAGATTRPAVAEQDDLIYGHVCDAALTLDVFTPPNPNGAAIVHVANGGWHRAHDDPAYFAEQLKRGYVVFRVFTASSPKFNMLEQMPMVPRAIRYIRHNAGRFNIDPNRIGIEGASSGGHLSLLAAMSADDGDPKAADPVDRTSSRVQAAAVFFPATDFLNYGAAGVVQDGTVGHLGNRASFDFTKFDPKLGVMVKITDEKERLDILKKVSPITYVDHASPPTFIIHGDRDNVIPLQQSESMIQSLKSAGVPAELVVHPNGGHPWPGFWLNDGGKLVDWFDRHLTK